MESSELYLERSQTTEFWNISEDNSNVSQNVQTICKFDGIHKLSDFFELFGRTECHKHSVGFTVFLCVANLAILLFGLAGNGLVIYVVTWKVKKKSASSLFIRNLATADMLVVLFCIPATLLANIFIPWVLGEMMCKAVVYAQGVSVFSSVYSLVAISFDRCRAMHQSLSITQHVSTQQARKIIFCIWLVALSIPFPWLIIFQLVKQSDYGLPLCQEHWPTKGLETLYFLLVNVVADYLLPLVLIALCNIAIWRNVPSSRENQASSGSVSSVAASSAVKRLRVLKMFSILTFVFFICWLPLYIVITWVKFAYVGTPLEQRILSVLIPTAQLLGSCNSCVNPVLYAILNQTFRETLKSIFFCSGSPCHRLVPSTFALVTGRESGVADVHCRVQNTRETAV